MLKNMLQAVIDTNILVRANINQNGSDYLIYKAFLNNQFELLYSDVLLKELTRVLNYPRIFNKYQFEKQIIEEFIDSIITFGKFVYAPKKVNLCRDRDDDELLSIALAIYTRKPIYIVSGDQDLLILNRKIKGLIIMTANKFLQQIRS